MLAFVPVFLLISVICLRCGINNKPPLEDMQEMAGWENSKFVNRYGAILLAIVTLVAAIISLKKAIAS